MFNLNRRLLLFDLTNVLALLVDNAGFPVFSKILPGNQSEPATYGRRFEEEYEKACSDMGLSMTTAFTIFAKKVSREKRIPFELSADPFYSESNMAHLRRGVSALNSGKNVEHAALVSSPSANLR